MSFGLLKSQCKHFKGIILQENCFVLIESLKGKCFLKSANIRYLERHEEEEAIVPSNIYG